MNSKIVHAQRKCVIRLIKLDINSVFIRYARWEVHTYMTQDWLSYTYMRFLLCVDALFFVQYMADAIGLSRIFIKNVFS